MKKLLIALLILVILVIAFFGKTLYQAGQFKTLTPHFNGTLSTIENMPGSEDITIHHRSGTAFISSDDRFKTWNGLEGGKGGIYSLDLKTPGSEPLLLTEHIGFEIHPHGISLYESPDGTLYLYAVDHAKQSHAILLFRFDRDHLDFIRKYADNELIISPNDVVAVDENRFYFTNDHGSKSKTGKLLQDYFQMAKSNVVYFNGTNYRVVANKLGYANGINISRDGKEIYVAATIGRSVWVYDRNPDSGALQLRDQVYLNTGVDNIELDEVGNLWVGCHPKLLTFAAHSKDLKKPAPSQVYKITKDASGKYQSEEIYLNNGDEISASSVAAVYVNTMLVGAVFDDRILHCTLN